MCIFLRKRVLLDSIKGHLAFLKLHQTCPPKKACLGVNFWAKSREIVQGCFSWRRKITIKVCFENLWSRICVQHQYSSTTLYIMDTMLAQLQISIPFEGGKGAHFISCLSTLIQKCKIQIFGNFVQVVEIKINEH